MDASDPLILARAVLIESAALLVRYASEPLASRWRRFIAGVLGALAPEELL
jgi:hypothetical protein